MFFPVQINWINKTTIIISCLLIKILGRIHKGKFFQQRVWHNLSFSHCQEFTKGFLVDLKSFTCAKISSLINPTHGVGKGSFQGMVNLGSFWSITNVYIGSYYQIPLIPLNTWKRGFLLHPGAGVNNFAGWKRECKNFLLKHKKRGSGS